MALAFLTVSTLLQGVALGLSVRIAQSRAAGGWLLLAIALGLMFIRRAFSFHAAALQTQRGDPIAELIALAISGLLVTALGLLARGGARVAVTDAEHRTSQRNTSLKRHALLLAGVGLSGASLLAVLVYTATQSMVTERLSRGSQQVARVLAAAAAQAREPHQGDTAALPRLESLWQRARMEFPGSYLCVIGSDGRLQLNTLRPTKVGTYVGAVALPGESVSSEPRTVGELLRQRGDWIGRNRNHAGHEQIAAYVYSAALGGLIAVHTGAGAIDDEVRRAVLPWLVALGSVLLFLLPVSMGLLYHVTARSEDAASEAEERSRETEDRYRQIVETTTQGVWMIDAEARTVFANERMAAMLGCKLDELQGQPLSAFMDDAGTHSALAMLTHKHGPEVQELRLNRRDGAELWASVSANPIFGPDGEYLGGLAMVSDVSDRRRMEAQVKQAQKMQAVGQLAGGIAHDFNNLLTVVEVNACLLAEEECEKSDRLEYVEEIREAVQRASALTQRLLAFSRKRAAQRSMVDVAEVVSKTTAMLRRLLGTQIKVETNLAPGLPSILADRALLEQALLNLIVNARDAMPNGGRLRISISASRRPQHSDPAADAPDSGLLLCVSDSGAGIAPEVMSHIFEPFFSTKERDRGTGLGLAIVYSFVQQHHGAIWVDSQLGQGTTFTLWLPAHVAADSSLEAAASAPAEMDATVLLAETAEMAEMAEMATSVSPVRSST